jgi:hypothetical protein
MKFLLTLTFLISGWAYADCAQAGEIPSASVQQAQPAEEFLNRFKDQRHLKLLEGATWTLTHNFSDFEHMETVLKTVQAYFEALGEYEKGERRALAQLGGIGVLKDKLAGWLNEEDQAIRAFAALVLGIGGDPSYAPQLAEALKERNYQESDRIHYDRGRIALALGLLGVTTYTANLAALLSSPNEYDRAGAAYGLGFLGAKEQARAVAKLLKDKKESVREAAKEALALLGATGMQESRKSRKP